MPMDLQTLLQHLPEILRQEASNAAEINLYNIGSYWAAFEQSAYNLQSISKEAEIIPMRLPQMPFPIIMATTAALPKLQCKTATKTKRTYATPKAPKPGFNSWHRSNTSALAAFRKS